MKKLLLIPLAVVMLAGCGAGSDELSNAEEADDSAATTSAESALTSELSDEVAQPQSASPETLATDATMRVGSHLQPAGCLTTTVSGATATYIFNDCTGPYGMVHVTGTVTAVYSWAPGGAVNVVLSGSGIKVNGATIDLNATAEAKQTGTVKSVEVVTNADGTGPRGNSISRDGVYTVTYDAGSSCITVAGTWTTRVGARSASTVVSGYQRCAGACPEAGGSIVHTTARDNVISVSYDGSAEAAYSTSRGRSGLVPLRCTVVN